MKLALTKQITVWLVQMGESILQLVTVIRSIILLRHHLGTAFLLCVLQSAILVVLRQITVLPALTDERILLSVCAQVNATNPTLSARLVEQDNL